MPHPSHCILCNLDFENIILLKQQIVFFWKILRLNWTRGVWYLCGVFLDLKKAFDSVNHEVLIVKLSKFSFSPAVIKWIKSYLTDRRQCVRVDQVTSQVVDNHVGVPQGSTLGPLLFSLFINDLPEACPPTVTCQMYADDAVIYLHAKNKKQAGEELSASMVNIFDWLINSCLQLNVDKTVCMFFSKSVNRDRDPEVTVAGKRLSVVHEFKYLGIVLDSKLTFKTQVKKL